MFLGPYDQGGVFCDLGIAGIQRFLNRVWQLVMRYQGSIPSIELDVESQQDLHQTIHKVREDIQALKYNTAIATLMSYLNTLEAKEYVSTAEIKSYLLMLAPFAPHITEELWSRMGESYSIHQQPFPQANREFLVKAQVTIAVQINGRTRTTLQLAPDASQEEALALAKQSQSLQRYLKEQEVRRVVYVPSRIINLVI
ncbi:class I tRNA ligase family protein [[Phormidium ambiguum] IAM M-71]